MPSDDFITLIQATTVCHVCGKKFHQIDGTEERALSVTRKSLRRHKEAEHEGGTDDE